MSEEESLKKIIEYVENHILKPMEKIPKTKWGELYMNMMKMVKDFTGCTDCTADHVFQTVYAMQILLVQVLISSKMSDADKAERLKLMGVIAYLLGRQYMDDCIDMATQLVAGT